MKDYGSDKIRSVGFFGHGGCGKTSLLDAMMFLSGAHDRHGRVDTGSSIGDTTDEEKERKISIQSHPLHCSWKEHSIFLIDTPGYMDFIGEVASSLRVADAALELAGNPLAGKRLKGRFEKEGLRSYRVWPLRIIYRFDVQLLSVVEVGHRRDIYH